MAETGMNLYRADCICNHAIVLAFSEAEALQCLTSGSDSFMTGVPTLQLIGKGIDLSYDKLPYNFCHSYGGGGYVLLAWTQQ